jgi:hypothetical protein
MCHYLGRKFEGLAKASTKAKAMTHCTGVTPAKLTLEHRKVDRILQAAN